MQKTVGQQRRFRQTTQKIIPIIGIFIFTLIGLFVIKFIPHAQSIISPIGRAYSSVINSISSQDESKKEIQKELSAQNITVNSLIETDTDITVTRDKNITYIFNKKKKISEQITSLQLILSRLTIEGKQASKIDFRFDNPVVTF